MKNKLQILKCLIVVLPLINFDLSAQIIELKNLNLSTNSDFPTPIFDPTPISHPPIPPSDFPKPIVYKDPVSPIIDLPIGRVITLVKDLNVIAASNISSIAIDISTVDAVNMISLPVPHIKEGDGLKPGEEPKKPIDDLFKAGIRLVNGIDPLTNTKTDIVFGYFKGPGVELVLDSDGGVAAKFDYEGNILKVKANVDGEFSNVEYQYKEGDNRIKIIGDATGKISVSDSYKFASTPTSVWSGGLTLTTDGDQIAVTASNNFVFDPFGKNDPIFEFNVADTYNFTAEENVIWFNVDLSGLLDW